MESTIPLVTRIMNAYAVAPDDLRPLLAEAFEAVGHRDRLLARMEILREAVTRKID